MRCFCALSRNGDREVRVLPFSFALEQTRSPSAQLTLRFLLANEDQAEAAVWDMSWTDSAMSDG